MAIVIYFYAVFFLIPYLMMDVVLMQGIGLSLEEALIFWRSEFTKLMDVDKVLVFLTPK